MRVLVAIAALLMAAPGPPLDMEFQGDYAHDPAAIVLIYCQRATGGVTGSAFKVSETTYITAHHVVAGGICAVGNAPVQITSLDEKRDYATFIGPASPAMLKPSCDGFRPGTVYAARGYPGGSSYNIFTPWLAMRAVWKGFGVFAGEAIGGMSGGPLLDPQGRVVGVVVMKHPARSMSLSNTGYCKS